jgi:glucose/arabinose dehydrogenase/PKD repeat protein
VPHVSEHAAGPRPPLHVPRQGAASRARRGFAAAVLLAALTSLTLALVAVPVGVAAPPADFQTSLVIGDGLDGPSGFEIAPDGRIFILERSGKIKIVKDGELLPTPFADLPSENTGDRGLIGIAFDPEFGQTNHYVYFYYTGHDLLNHLVRFSADQDVATNGPIELFRTSSPSHELHVGGSIRFGPDGKLYFAVGDNGNGFLAQDLSNPHGKILRINKDGSIPADNPFADQPGKLGAIWAYGFRNPWRFQFDSATGRLYVGDVGDFTWEEVNRVVKGGNYGWSVHEGICTSGCAGYIDPLYVYPHAGESAAVTGGPVYRAQMFPPDYQGDLFFGDYAKGFIRNADLDANGDITAVHDFDDQAGSVVDLKVAPDGSLYYITYFPGALYRITYNSQTHLPVASASADVTKGIEPLTVHFSSAGSRDPDGDPLSYEWSFGDGTTSTEANPTKTYSEKGVYIARLTVSAGGDEVPAQPIVIQAGLPPELNISTPAEGDLYRAGDTITYNAFARDGAGFDLDDGDIKTEVRLHHGTHFHPFVGPLTGRAGSFTIPRTGEASADTSYEIKVTATDSNGLFTDKIVNVFPRKSQVSLATSPSGLGLTVDGVPVSTPRTFTGVEGFQRDLFAPSNAVAQDGTALQFGGWSDGKSIRHVISTPEDDTTYAATYRPSQPFTATFYDNTTFSGTPVVTRQDPTINFAWGSGSPDPALPSDGFSVRWKKTQWFGAGRYEFTAVADDGVRLYIDGRRVIRQWQGPANTEFTHVVELGEGRHTIKMDYVERGGDALAALHWEGASDQPSDTYRAEYWNTPPGSYEIPSTSPDIARDEDAIDHQWGAGSPDPAIAANRFLARWTRTISVEPGDYDFAVTADDGVRLYVGGVPVIDKWIDQAPTTYHATLPLDGGPHTVVMEYYENSGEATARLDYSRVGDPPADDTYHAQYWNTPDAVGPPSIPTGPADLEREDETLDFDWGGGSPGSPIAGDRFVARWTKTVVLSAGLYRFSGVRDDGLRAYIDNLPVVDKWTNGNEEYSVDKVVSGGPHELRVEYFEAFGGAGAEFSYERIGDVVPGDGGYTGEYFDNRNLAGTAVVTRPDDDVDFEWGGGRPADGVPADDFSARWTKSLAVDEAGSYRFTVTGDDGVRLYVDGTRVLDKWIQQGRTTYTVTRHLSQGPHEIVLEYFEAAGDAVAKLDYEQTSDPPPPPPDPFAAEYFDNSALSGAPVLTRADDAIDFDWGAGGPGSAVPSDRFSARWTRTKDYEAGTYRFSVTGDDGIRVLVDGEQVVDGWFYQPPTTYGADVPLSQGQHTVVVEYFEHTGGAVARFSESKVAGG